MSGPCFFGWNSTNHLSSIVKSLLSLEGALITSHSLADDFCMFVDPDVGSSAEHFLNGFGEHVYLDINMIIDGDITSRLIEI